MKTVTAQLYEWSLKAIPEDSKEALRKACETEHDEAARKVLRFMLKAADAAKTNDKFVCSDAGVPTYVVKIGTRVQFDGDIKRAITDGFDHLCNTINPPLLKFVTNPLTNERSFRGKDMPIVSYDLVSDADYVEIICSPKALGSGRWAALEIFVSPTLEQIE